MNHNTRLLTQSNSKLAKSDVVKVLAQEEAWSSLPEETQLSLYATLPPPRDGHPIDHRTHPFKTEYSQFVKHFLREWQSDLKEGRNTLKWRNEASQASAERAAGMFDHILALEREEKWGKDKLDVSDFRKACGENGFGGSKAAASVEQDDGTEKLEMGIFADQQGDVEMEKIDGSAIISANEDQLGTVLDFVDSSESEKQAGTDAMLESVGSSESEEHAETTLGQANSRETEKSEDDTNESRSEEQVEEKLDRAGSIGSAPQKLANEDGKDADQQDGAIDADVDNRAVEMVDA